MFSFVQMPKFEVDLKAPENIWKISKSISKEDSDKQSSDTNDDQICQAIITGVLGPLRKSNLSPLAKIFKPRIQTPPPTSPEPREYVIFQNETGLYVPLYDNQIVDMSQNFTMNQVQFQNLVSISNPHVQQWIYDQQQNRSFSPIPQEYVYWSDDSEENQSRMSPIKHEEQNFQSNETIQTSSSQDQYYSSGSQVSESDHEWLSCDEELPSQSYMDQNQYQDLVSSEYQNMVSSDYQNFVSSEYQNNYGSQLGIGLWWLN